MRTALLLALAGLLMVGYSFIGDSNARSLPYWPEVSGLTAHLSTSDRHYADLQSHEMALALHADWMVVRRFGCLTFMAGPVSYIFKRSENVRLKCLMIGRCIAAPSAKQVFVVSLLAFGAMTEVLLGVICRWHDSFTTLFFSTGWFWSPLLIYIAIRRQVETGFCRFGFLSVLFSFAGLALWAITIYYLFSRGLSL